MLMRPLIRTAEIRDLASMLSIDQESFPEPLPSFVLRQLFDAAGDLAVVAEKDSRIIGYTLALRGPGPNAAWLASAAVVSSERANRIGSLLGEELLRRLAKASLHELYLTCRPDNKPVVEWSRRAGFEIIGDEPHYFGPGERRLVMRRVARESK